MRQQKITTAFERQDYRNEYDSDPEDDIAELMEANRKLQEIVQQREALLFQMQTNMLPQPKLFQPRYRDAISDEISSFGGEVTLRHKQAKIKSRLEAYLYLFGIQVKTYTDELCIVLYNVQLEGKSLAQYAIRFVKVPSSDDWLLSKYHVPAGFNMDIMSGYDPMSLDYMRQLHLALVAHHDRQLQIEMFKEEMPTHIQVHSTTVSICVEMAFPMLNINDRSMGLIGVTLQLKYNPFEVRPNKVKVIQNIITEINQKELLSAQFEAMKNNSLSRAFTKSVQKDGSNNFYCPFRDELDSFMRAEMRPRKHKSGHRQTMTTVNGSNSDNEYAIQSKRSHKSISKHKHRDADDSSEASDTSFTTIRKQMKQKKQSSSQDKPENTFKKPSLPYREYPNADSEDDNDRVTNVLLEKNKTKKSEGSFVPPKMNSYQIAGGYESESSTRSYVYIPESKTKKTQGKSAKSPNNLKSSKNFKSPKDLKPKNKNSKNNTSNGKGGTKAGKKNTKKGKENTESSKNVQPKKGKAKKTA